MNLLTTIPQSSALTITPLGHPQDYFIDIKNIFFIFLKAFSLNPMINFTLTLENVKAN